MIFNILTVFMTYVSLVFFFVATKVSNICSSFTLRCITIISIQISKDYFQHICISVSSEIISLNLVLVPFRALYPLKSLSKSFCILYASLKFCHSLSIWLHYLQLCFYIYTHYAVIFILIFCHSCCLMCIFSHLQLL